MYLVKIFQETPGVEVLGVKSKISLNWADGMIGVIPLFKTKKEALKYAKGNEELILKVTTGDNK